MAGWQQALPGFVLPREIANRFGPPRVLAPDGTLREPDPELLERGKPVWGRDAQR
jgi:hypothetical protein